MAVNQEDKKALIDRILPKKVDILALSSGIQILSERITTPRILKFDQPGRCKGCKSPNFDVKGCIEKNGVWILCPRIKGIPFVPFDIIYDFPNHTVFHLKSWGQIFTIPHDSDNPEDGDDDSTKTPSLLSKTGPTTGGGRRRPSKIPKTSNNSKGGNRKNLGSPPTNISDDDDEIIFLGQKPAAGDTIGPFSNLADNIKQEIQDFDNPGEVHGKHGEGIGTNKESIEGEEGREQGNDDDDDDELEDGDETENEQMVEDDDEKDSGQQSIIGPSDNNRKRSRGGSSSAASGEWEEEGGEDEDELLMKKERKKVKLEDEIARIFWERKQF